MFYSFSVYLKKTLSVSEITTSPESVIINPSTLTVISLSKLFSMAYFSIKKSLYLKLKFDSISSFVYYINTD